LTEILQIKRVNISVKILLVFLNYRSYRQRKIHSFEKLYLVKTALQFPKNLQHIPLPGSV